VEALVITGGSGPGAAFLKQLAAKADIVIAADSGLDCARGADIVPDLIVGDFDSIEDKASLLLYEKEHIFQFPVEKDATDTELALSLAWERGADRVILAGGGGGRLDHLLGIASLFRRSPAPDAWHSEAGSAFRIGKGQGGLFAVTKGATVSVFPLSDRSADMSSQGLRWSLEGLSWGPGEFGVSNIADEDRIRIHSGEADLLVILPLGAERLA
jgi:thiamine pyrophosphokinase